MTLFHLALEIVFWCSLVGVGYAYLGYPPLIWLLSRLFGTNSPPPTVRAGEWPEVSLLIAAYNEEREIGARVRNALGQDYPAGMLEVVVASDGCTDRTNDIVRAFSEAGVRLLDSPQRRGKAAVLNAAFPNLGSDIVVLSDANTHFSDPAAIRNLVRWFRDPAVGAVCGRLLLTDPATGRNVDGMYWKYETFLKGCEGRLGGLLGANGAIYAVRRELFTGLPPGTVLDDFVVPLLARLRTGARIVYDPEARADELTPAAIGHEFKRRARLGAGGAQCLGLLGGLLHPRHGWTAFTFWCHKLLRWVCPFLLVAALLTSAMLAAAESQLYQALFAGQVLFYGLAVLGSRLPPAPAPCKLVRLVTMFTWMNAALLVGFVRWARGAQRAAWERTPRTAPQTCP